MGKKHHKKHNRPDKDERNKRDDDDNRPRESADIKGVEDEILDDDGASNSTADSIADDDAPSSQDSEERTTGLSGIKLVLKMNNSEGGATSDVYSPSHVYSPSYEEKRRKHKKKKKKKSSDRDKHRYLERSPHDSDDQRLTPFRIALNTAVRAEHHGDGDSEPCVKKRIVEVERIRERLDETVTDGDKTLEGGAEDESEVGFVIGGGGERMDEGNEDCVDDDGGEILDECSGIVSGGREVSGVGRGGDAGGEMTGDGGEVTGGNETFGEGDETNDDDTDVEKQGEEREGQRGGGTEEEGDEGREEKRVGASRGEGEPVVKSRPGSVLKPLLTHVHKMLTKIDVHGIFAYPVNDLIAPGYSTLIQVPMDLTTMASKISGSLYDHVGDMKADFELMCTNAMTYNHCDTIYYKEAARFLQAGNKIVSREKLLKMVRTNSFLAGVTLHDLGLDQPQLEAVVPLERLSDNIISQHTVASPQPSKPDLSEDSMTPEDILTQAQAAAVGAAQRLTQRKPNSRFGFLKRREDGSTSFNIVNPDNDGIVSETERHVDIGSLLGKLPSGGSSVAGFKEDRRNTVKTINYLNYGPFSSYAPQYDSSFANVSKDESDLLLSTYKDEIGVNYAKSVLSFVDSAGDYAVRMVNQLLDMLTNNEHSKSQQILKERTKKAEQEEVAVKSAKMSSGAVTQASNSIDYKSLESLSDVGIDTSFLNDFKHAHPVPASTNPVQQQLDTTADLLHRLSQSQTDRLNLTPPTDLNQVTQPSSQELQLANQVCDKLRDITKQITPGDVSSTAGIRKAMGITPRVVNEPINVVDTVPPDAAEPMETSVTAAPQQSEEDIQMELRRLLDESAGINTDCPPLVMTDDNLLEHLC